MQCLVALAFFGGVIVIASALTWGAIALIRRDRHRGSGFLGSAMQNLEGLFVESKKHVIEAEQREDADEDDSGDPPEK